MKQSVISLSSIINTDWNLIYTYAQSKYKISVYIKEDLEVINAPDFQTGISLTIPISKNNKK